MSFVALQKRLRAQCIELRGWLDVAIGHNLLKRFQSRFDVLDVQPTDLFFVLKPAPEPDPKHRQEGNPEDSFEQQCFLEGEDVDDAMIHINLLTRTTAEI